jgi:hypothetical protein
MAQKKKSEFVDEQNLVNALVGLHDERVFVGVECLCYRAWVCSVVLSLLWLIGISCCLFPESAGRRFLSLSLSLSGLSLPSFLPFFSWFDLLNWYLDEPSRCGSF